MKKDVNIPETERMYLNCLLNAADEGISIETLLQKDDFHCSDYGRIFETLKDQWGKGVQPDISTLRSALPDMPPSVISSCKDGIYGYSNAPYYENEIFEASKERLFIKALKLAKEEIDSGGNTDAVINNFLPAITTLTAARNETKIRSAADLLAMEFPPVNFIIGGLIGEGLTLMAGAPKVGKSWFVLNLAIAAATGGCFLGKLPAKKTGTLYLALEDTERRIHGRLKQLKAPAVGNLKIATHWRDGYTGLENYLRANNWVGLVIVDTMARFANIEDMNDYSKTTHAMARLKRVADDMGVSIILIHHAKKMGRDRKSADWQEAVLGSTGLTGAVDSTVYIDRERDSPTATLHATGRDWAGVKNTLKFDVGFGGWFITDIDQGQTGNKPFDWDSV
jgi:replicative DNA helicase